MSYRVKQMSALPDLARLPATDYNAQVVKKRWLELEPKYGASFKVTGLRHVQFLLTTSSTVAFQLEGTI